MPDKVHWNVRERTISSEHWFGDFIIWAKSSAFSAYIWGTKAKKPMQTFSPILDKRVIIAIGTVKSSPVNLLDCSTLLTHTNGNQT